MENTIQASGPQFKELEAEFGLSIIPVSGNFGIARVSNKTGHVQVDTMFEFLDIKVQKFVLHHCKAMYEHNDTSNRYLMADKVAFAKATEQYPDCGFNYWLRAFMSLLKHMPTQQTLERFEMVIQSMGIPADKYKEYLSKISHVGLGYPAVALSRAAAEPFYEGDLQ